MLYSEEAGVISRNRIWVLHETGYSYYNESLFRLIEEVILNGEVIDIYRSRHEI